MSNDNHPRQYRVERITFGVDWSEWTYTYHRTLALAEKAIARFFKGEGKYNGYQHRDNSVILAQRVGEGRYARYERVRHITKGEWQATAHQDHDLWPLISKPGATWCRTCQVEVAK